MAATDIHRTIEAVWRMEPARLIASLVRMVRDVGLAEELAQDALVVALEQWPKSSVPDNPRAWLMATAKRRAIDLLRRRKLLERKHGRRWRFRISMPRSTTMSATTCCDWYSHPVIQFSPPRSARGYFLEKLTRFDEARVEFERAASLTRNACERELLLARAARCCPSGNSLRL